MRNIVQAVQLDDGTIAHAHINRRGCEGPWTAEDAAAMAEIIKAAVAHSRELRAATRAKER